MRQAILALFTAGAGLAACAPVPASPYGYAPASYGYYDGGYAAPAAPYYAEPAYVAPGPAIIIGGGERRWEGGDRDRYERRGDEGRFRGNPNPPNRDFGRGEPPRNFGGSRPSPAQFTAPRPAPAPQAVPPAPSGGAAFEQWNRTHVNASGGSPPDPAR